ncbi:MAG TPA: hypothetical protein PKV18_12145 [Tenuifilaceae bacterium]|nr:hypothetical protein [Tenuifilaceae bacterium]
MMGAPVFPLVTYPFRVAGATGVIVNLTFGLNVVEVGEVSEHPAAPSVYL